MTQNKCKVWHDKHLKLHRFQPGQLVLKYDRRNEIKPGKFKIRWVRPYQIWEVGDNGAIKLSTLHGLEVPQVVNGSKLKIYHARKSLSLLQSDQDRPSPLLSQVGEVVREN